MVGNFSVKFFGILAFFGELGEEKNMCSKRGVGRFLQEYFLHLFACRFFFGRGEGSKWVFSQLKVSKLKSENRNRTSLLRVSFLLKTCLSR